MGPGVTLAQGPMSAWRGLGATAARFFSFKPGGMPSAALPARPASAPRSRTKGRSAADEMFTLRPLPLGHQRRAEALRVWQAFAVWDLDCLTLVGPFSTRAVARYPT